MRPNHVMVDYENLQPDDLGLLEKNEAFRVTVFLGAQQTRLDVKLVTALQPLGKRGAYVQIEGNGPNALDFHIAYYIGRVAEREPTAFFHVISRDHGFDPLIKHLKSKKIFASRCLSIAEIPLFDQGSFLGLEAKAERALNNLISRGESRPSSRKSLVRSVASLFQSSELSEIEEIVAILQSRGLMSVEGETVRYHFGE